jgi:hypothetical protein
MRRIEFEWLPHTGQKVIAVPGPLPVGEQIEFFWHTTKEDDPDHPFSGPGSKNGNFFVDSLPGNNATLTGEFKGVEAQGAEEGAIRSGSGQTSFSWPFKKSGANNYSLKPDSDYSVTVTISVVESAGINGKLNCGTRD